MIKLLILILILSGCAGTPYAKIGAGYKKSEADMTYEADGKHYSNSPISARLEVGHEAGNITYGISHHSQWLVGFPFNNDGEYHKTEIFIDYKFQ